MSEMTDAKWERIIARLQERIMRFCYCERKRRPEERETPHDSLIYHAKQDAERIVLKAMEEA